jgi:ribosomal protein L7Ae-like RNA K-turn-binding protein
MLARRGLDLIGLARRAGQLVAGFDQVADWLRNGKAAVLLGARDGAADGRRKLRALARGLPVIEAFDRRELGSAIGRDEAVHVAMAPGGLAERLLAEATRLRGFRPDETGERVSDADVGTEEPTRS